MRPVLMHSSYHKCMTVYFSGVVKKILGQNTEGAKYAHFNSDINRFYSEQSKYELTSVNNHAIDLDRYENYRVTRLIRDPRDLVVSGYFYHHRVGENWCDEPASTDSDWSFVNGHVPVGMRNSGLTFSSWLQSLDSEEGLMGELEFRKHHFESMRAWPSDDPDVMVVRYEDILGNESKVMNDMLGFLGWSRSRRLRGSYHAWRRSAPSQSRGRFHVRDPNPGQWRKHFTPRINEAFNDLYGDLLDSYGYSRT